MKMVIYVYLTENHRYWQMPFNQMLFGFRFPESGSSIQFQATGVLSSYSSLYNVVAPGSQQQVALLSKSQWLGMFVGAGSLQSNCNMIGFNLAPSGVVSANVQVRIGYLANEQNDCGSPDSFVG